MRQKDAERTNVVEKPQVLTASDLKKFKVVNDRGEDLGKIEELAIDLVSGRVAYIVASFEDKLFAIPWHAAKISHHDRKFILTISKDVLKDAPGFDKDNWPNWADPNWADHVSGYYRATIY